MADVNLVRIPCNLPNRTLIQHEVNYNCGPQTGMFPSHGEQNKRIPGKFALPFGNRSAELSTNSIHYGKPEGKHRAKQNTKKKYRPNAQSSAQRQDVGK